MTAMKESQGRKLYRQLAAKYDFEPHEVTLLELAANQLDRLDALDAIVRREGDAMLGDRVPPGR